MPRFSSVTFSVQPVEQKGQTSGYVISGFLSEKQLVELRNLVNSPEYERTKKWRGEYQEMAKAIVSAINNVV